MQQSSRILDEMKQSEVNYPQDIRRHFRKIDKALQCHNQCKCFLDEQASQLEVHSQRSISYEKAKGFKPNSEKYRKYLSDAGKPSEGDADRSMLSVCCGDSSRQSHGPPSVHHAPSSSKMKMSPSGKEKYRPSFIPSEPNLQDCIGDHKFLSDIYSNMGDSEDESCASQKSSKTMVSRLSSKDLRNLVRSKCEMHEEVEKTIEQMGLADKDTDKWQKDAHMSREKKVEEPETLPTSHCKHCNDHIHPLQLSRRDVTTEIGKFDFTEGENLDTLTISVDDVVNSKVINPMIRKLQRMYINNLKEEMSLMEDLERLPRNVNEVYKSVFKHRE